jgi:hypothetical protein
MMNAQIRRKGIAIASGQLPILDVAFGLKRT